MCNDVKYKIINHSSKSIPAELFTAILDLVNADSMQFSKINSVAEEYNLRVNEIEIDFTGDNKKLIFTIEDNFCQYN